MTDISSLSSATTLLSVSYLGHTRIESRTKLIETYKEKYSVRTKVYEDWRKHAISSFSNIREELDLAVKRNQISIEESKKQLDAVKSSHLEFVMKMSVLESPENKKKKRKADEIEK
jgi:hypothetical protein